MLLVSIFLNQSISAMNGPRSKEVEVTVFNDSKNLVIVKYHEPESVCKRLKDLGYESIKHLCFMETLMPNEHSTKITISYTPARWLEIYFNNGRTEIVVDEDNREILKMAFVPQETDGIWKMMPIAAEQEALKSAHINALIAMIKANGSIELKPS